MLLRNGFDEVEYIMFNDKSCVVVRYHLNSAIHCIWCFGVICSTNEGCRCCFVFCTTVLDRSVQ